MAEAKAQEFIAPAGERPRSARVRLATGSGQNYRQQPPFENYFPIETLRMLAVQP